jgi:hypothetical protein
VGVSRKPLPRFALQIDSFSPVMGYTERERTIRGAALGALTHPVILQGWLSRDSAARRGDSPVKWSHSETGERRWKAVQHAEMILPAEPRTVAKG